MLTLLDEVSVVYLVAWMRESFELGSGNLECEGMSGEIWT